MGEVLEEESAVAASHGDNELQDAAALAAAEKCASNQLAATKVAVPLARFARSQPILIAARGGGLWCRFGRMSELDTIRAGYWSTRKRQNELSISSQR